jgi:hypothetical protein
LRIVDSTHHAPDDESVSPLLLLHEV